MNWSRIKSILIVLLILGNFILAANYFLLGRSFLKKDSSSSEIKGLYEARGIVIEFEIEEFPSSFSTYKIEQLLFTKSYLELVLGENLKRDGDDFLTDEYRARIDRSNLIIAHLEHFKLISSMPDFKPENLIELDEGNKHEVLNRAAKVLDRYYLSVDSDKMEMYEEGGYRVLKLVQQVGGYDYDESVILLWFMDEKIVGLYVDNFVAYVGDSNEKYAIISVNEALYKAVPNLHSEDSLVEVKLVYRLDSNAMSAENVVQGNAYPFYMLKFKSGKHIYVSALK